MKRAPSTGHEGSGRGRRKIYHMKAEECDDRWQGVNNGWSAILSSLKSLLETGKEISYT